MAPSKDFTLFPLFGFRKPHNVENREALLQTPKQRKTERTHIDCRERERDLSWEEKKRGAAIAEAARSNKKQARRTSFAEEEEEIAIVEIDFTLLLSVFAFTRENVEREREGSVERERGMEEWTEENGFQRNGHFIGSVV